MKFVVGFFPPKKEKKKKERKWKNGRRLKKLALSYFYLTVGSFNIVL